jgi:RND family efflux transporter MFP subunit
MTTNEPIQNEPRQEVDATAPRQPQRKVPKVVVILAAAGAIALLLEIRSGIAARVSAHTNLSIATEAAATPIVSVVHPREGAPLEELTLPGNTQAFTDTPIYARTSGYLKRWYHDLGAHVRRGELLAEIEAPEIDKQLQQARADLEAARATSRLAETTAARWQVLLQTDAVSKQETDEKLGDLSAKKANLESMASGVRRLEDLQSFQKVYAPFDGVITARKTDVGALIDAGSAAPAKELFHLAAVQRLRVFVAVPEAYAHVAKPGLAVPLTGDAYQGRTFQGTLVRTSNAIDPAAHTLLAEVEVDNRDEALLPGAYVTVHLKLPRRSMSLTVPSNALLFRSEGPEVGVVKNGHSELAQVKIGRDYGSEIEILAGLEPSDAVILDPPDSLSNGMPVRVAGNSAAQAPR